MLRTRNASIWFKVMVHTAAVYMLLSGVTAHGKTLSVSPPSHTWSGVTPGAGTETPFAIKITNLSERQRAYKLTAKKCSDASSTPSDGCEDIPEASWVAFESRFVTIKAGEQVQVNAYLNVPGNQRHCGKSWQCYVEVREDVPQYGYLQGQPDLFALAVLLKVVVNTAGSVSMAEPNTTTFTPLIMTRKATKDTPDLPLLIPPFYGWLYYGTVTDMDRLIGGLAGPIIAPRNIEMPGKTEQM
jgi:hypothetical protein